MRRDRALILRRRGNAAFNRGEMDLGHDLHARARRLENAEAGPMANYDIKVIATHRNLPLTLDILRRWAPRTPLEAFMERDRYLPDGSRHDGYAAWWAVVWMAREIADTRNPPLPWPSGDDYDGCERILLDYAKTHNLPTIEAP